MIYNLTLQIFCNWNCPSSDIQRSTPVTSFIFLKMLQPYYKVISHFLNLACSLGWTQNHWRQISVQFSSFQLLSCVWLFVTPWWTSACQASLSITNSQSLLKLMFIESVIPTSHLIVCHPLLLPLVLPSIKVFSSESVLRFRWPKYWNFSFSISPSNEYSGLISFRIDWLDLLAVKGLSRVFSNTTVQKHQFFRAQLSL